MKPIVGQIVFSQRVWTIMNVASRSSWKPSWPPIPPLPSPGRI